MLLYVVAGAEPQQFLLLQPSVRQILHILQTGSRIREGIVIDRDTDAYGDKTVHLLNQVEDADLLQLMNKEEVAKYLESTDPVPEVTEPEEKEQPNLLPLIGVLLVAGIGGGAFFLMKSKGKQKESAKPVPTPTMLTMTRTSAMSRKKPRIWTSSTTAWTWNPSDKEQA